MYSANMQVRRRQVATAAVASWKILSSQRCSLLACMHCRWATLLNNFSPQVFLWYHFYIAFVITILVIGEPSYATCCLLSYVCRQTIISSFVECHVTTFCFSEACDVLQGLLTCGYITLLSSFGERMAARLRCRLFAAVIVQDIAFFDANKTGEIVSRCIILIYDICMRYFSAALC